MRMSGGGALAARAKINLFLHVGERRADGFHPLQSLAVFPDLGDAVTADDGETLSLAVEGPFAAALAGEGDNLVLRAARALAARAGAADRGARLTLVKNLPVASGIGGGSADAAAALRALAALWRLDVTQQELCAIAAELGSDIPVCVLSRPCWMEGRGEILTPLPASPRLAMLLVNPNVAVPTRDVFAALRSRSGAQMVLPARGFRDTASLLGFLQSTRNDLEAPARAIQPVIGAVLDALSGVPDVLFARMSGSGATCFALFSGDTPCKDAAARLAQQHPGWWVAPGSVPAAGIS